MNTRTRRSSFLWACVALLVVSCDRDNETPATTTTATPTGFSSAASVVTPAEIINDPAAWVGQRVTVAGDVEEVWTPRAFNMDSGVTAGELLVVSKEAYPTLQDHDPLVDDVATVTGTVRLLVAAEIEREVGWDLQPEIEAEFSGKPVLVVENAAFRRGKAAAGTPAPISDLLIIINDPNRLSLVGRTVRLANAQVLRVAGDRSFWVGPSEAQSLLAVLAPGLDQPPFEDIVDVNRNQIRTMIGEIRRAPSAAAAGQQMKLKKDDAAALEKAQVYLHVTAIELQPR